MIPLHDLSLSHFSYQIKTVKGEFERFHSVLSILSYLLKAPMVPRGTPVINALFRQRACIENIFRLVAYISRGLKQTNNYYNYSPLFVLNGLQYYTATTLCAVAGIEIHSTPT